MATLEKEKPKKKRIQVDINEELAEDVSDVLHSLGMTPSVLITALYTRVAAEGRVPFELALTPEEKAKQDLIRASRKVPTVKIDTPEELEEWFEEHE